MVLSITDHLLNVKVNNLNIFTVVRHMWIKKMFCTLTLLEVCLYLHTNSLRPPTSHAQPLGSIFTVTSVDSVGNVTDSIGNSESHTKGDNGDIIIKLNQLDNDDLQYENGQW
jgi:hypothetical protein